MTKFLKIVMVLSTIMMGVFLALSYDEMKKNNITPAEVIGKVGENVKNRNVFDRVSNYEEVKETIKVPLDGAGFITINSDNIDITVTEDSSNKNEIKVTFAGDIRESLRDSFFTNKKERNTLMLDFNTQDAINPSSRGLEAKITLPGDYRGSLNIKSVSGSVNVTLNKVKNVDIESGNGNINIVSKAEDFRATARSSSGDIELNGAKAASFDLSSSSGNLEVNALQVAGNISSSSGNIKLTSQTLISNTYARSDSGDTSIKITDDYGFEISSSTGYLSVKGASGKERMKGSFGSSPKYKIYSTSGAGNITVK